jgi:hypothetical protein
MKTVGIDTVILIRCGYKKWLTYPSQILVEREACYLPPVDLVEMFLLLSEKHRMNFFFGLYDSGKYWSDGHHQKEIDINKRVIEEVWTRYGKREGFKGWYIPQEVSRQITGVSEMYAQLGTHCKHVSGGLPILISPYIDGIKNISQFSSTVEKLERISIAEHERNWNEIFSAIRQGVDIVAFQDGHVDFDELVDFLSINKSLADRHGLVCWTNTETFDRDMPIKFLPIKWEKLLFKLNAAKQVGIQQAITFEFSHFMSPQSAYLQAGHLYHRYQEYLDSLS